MIMEEKTSLIPNRSNIDSTISGGWDWKRTYLDLIERLAKVILIDNHIIDGDAVVVGVKQFVVIWILAILFWSISGISILTHMSWYRNTSKPYNWIWFIPMWFGSCIGLSGCISVFWRLRSTAKLIPRERRHYMISQGILSDHSYVEFENLSLMKLLLLWAFAGFVTFCSLLIFQVFVYLWLNSIITNIMDIYIPLGILCLVWVAYMAIMKLFGFKNCALVLLSVFQVLLFGAKLAGHHHALAWICATIPLYLISAILLGDFIKIWYMYFRHRIVLHLHQHIALVSYIISLLLINGMTLYASTHSKDFSSPSQITDAFCITFIGVLISLTLSLILLWRYEGCNLPNFYTYSHSLDLNLSDALSPGETENSAIWTWSLGVILLSTEIQMTDDSTSRDTKRNMSVPITSHRTSYGTEIELPKI